MLVEKKSFVGMAQIQIASVPTVFTCLGLGSCIGLCVIDRSIGVAGMIHIMLPAAFKNRPVDKIGKFADTGIPEMIRLLEAAGASKSRLVAAYAGGASVFKFGTGTEGAQDIGGRNAASVRSLLESLRLPVLGVDVGGSGGRTIFFDSGTGEVRVKAVKSGENTLCVLRR